jgi:hypothetical protein
MQPATTGPVDTDEPCRAVDAVPAAMCCVQAGPPRAALIPRHAAHPPAACSPRSSGCQRSRAMLRARVGPMLPTGIASVALISR